VINASPLHMGMLTDEGAPEWRPAPKTVLDAARQAAAICRAHGRSLPEIALRSCLADPQIASTFMGMETIDRVMQNLRALEAADDAAILAEMDVVFAEARGVTWVSGRPENQA
jgi:L-galactose dehydrogenase